MLQPFVTQYPFTSRFKDENNSKPKTMRFVVVMSTFCETNEPVST